VDNQRSVKNAAGNLVLHIIGGGTNHLIGATLAHTSYVCNRDQEFIRKGVARKELAAQLEELIPIIKNTLNNLGQEGMEAEYPFMFDDDMKRLISYILLQLLVHLNYHLGQVNYLWRILE
jgi:hypothetical protein